MAGWISSKLKVAENLLQQIDQQAAESLRKEESKQSDGLDAITSQKSSGIVPLRDQLKKKTSEDNENLEKLYNDSVNHGEVKSSSDEISKVSKLNLKKDVGKKPNSSLNDSDWTELLNTPKQHVVTKANRSSGARKDGVKAGIMGLKGKGNGKVVGKTVRKEGDGNGEKGSGVLGVGGGSGMGSRKIVEGSEPSLRLKKVEGYDEVERERNITGDGNGNGNGNGYGEGGGSLGYDESMVKVDSPTIGNSENVSVLMSDEGKIAVCDDERIGRTTFEMNCSDEGIPKTGIRGFKSVSQSAGNHESDSDSCSTSDSGAEQEREERMERRRQILAAKAAAKASEAIKEQENIVARLEGEKQSLEKILEEQANQAAQEASELQAMTMEMMEATEVEKQKHNHTRMEVLAQLAKLETANANLAKLLGSTQWNLEIEVNRLAELRHQIEVKEAVLEELKREIYSVHQIRATLTSLAVSKGFELQKEMLEAERAFATDKNARLQEKVMKLEANINMTLKEMENSTEVEVELRRRLWQMTDHLIQKQAQVESLSSNKGTLLFRTEAVSRLLEENKSLISASDISGNLRKDLEAGTWESTGSKLRPMLENKIQSGRQHLGSLLRQLDAIFSAGAVFLARNPAAKLWSLVYLISLHLWVLYIFFSHSQSTEDSTSSSVVSLENINGSIGV
ncbi:LOW QUALITY PROTEIN: golgin candidate 2-like [Chenopodium quinoa]|uniref:LOW QUALITY PROTEIN: golgin candidate 2-like n=1 Tax=Chenopodium quinoa TaxID=63459 RepID=UPI000B76F85B|nr:LOW QUALITY PROTEIN: golgin candidate 2-like [Chenopodium quinoa]